MTKLLDTKAATETTALQADSDELNERLTFMELDAHRRGKLSAIGPLIEDALPQALDDLYRQIGRFEATRALFDEPERLQGARRAQLSHWKSVSSGDFGGTFAAASRAVGEAHARVGLEPRWYIGGYALVLSRLLRELLTRRLDQGAAASSQGVLEEVDALVKAVLLDVDLSVSAYIDAARAAELASETRLGVALDVAKSGVLELDLARRSVWFTPQVAAILGRQVTFEDFAGKGFSMCHPDDKARFDEVTAGWIVGRHAPFEFRVLLPSGEERWISVHGEKVLDEHGKLARIVGLIMDVDEKKRQELALAEAQQLAQAATEAKSQFLANISHELRTPLTGIIGFAELAQREQDLSERMQRYVDRICSASKSLLATINDLLDYSKLEAGEIKIKRSPSQLRPILKDALSLFAPRASQKGVELRLAIDETLPECLLVDPDRVRQVLLNLIGNAVKFTDQGEVTASASYDPGCEQLIVRVLDTGPGVCPDLADRLFLRFAQADDSATRKHGGTGLGLSICRGLIDAMGGEIGVDGGGGSGACFWFKIPAITSTMVDNGGADEPGPVLPPESRVLIVDDHAQTRELVRSVLMSMGADVTEIDSGEGAVEIASRAPVDLILMDMRLPGMTGLEAARSIRARPGPNQSIPILLFSADADASGVDDEGLFDGVISKPISIRALSAILAQVFVDDQVSDPYGAETPDADARRFGRV